MDYDDFISQYIDLFQSRNTDSLYNGELNDFYNLIINNLSKNLFECKNPAEPISFRSSNYLNFEIYGAKDIEKKINQAKSEICHHTALCTLLEELRNSFRELISRRRNRDEKQIVDEITRIKSKIIDYRNKLNCTNCNSMACRNILDELISQLPFFIYTFGTFSTDEITLYIQCIKECSSNEEYPLNYLNTLSHETFHAYHYFYFVKNDQEDYWNKDYEESRFCNKQAEKNDWMKSDDCRIEGYMSDSRIVKESLASYYEYCVLDSYRNIEPICGVMADDLMASWDELPVKFWSYAGARAFANWAEQNDSEGLFENDLFKKVLKTSLYDWKTACDLILENL